MVAHPLHELFTTVDIETADDGTVLQRELHCNYCARVWNICQHQGKGRAAWLGTLRDHMARECNHNSSDIHTVTLAISLNNVHAYVARMKALHRCWPPLTTIERNPLTPHRIISQMLQVNRCHHHIHTCYTRPVFRCRASMSTRLSTTWMCCTCRGI